MEKSLTTNQIRICPLAVCADYIAADLTDGIVNLRRFFLENHSKHFAALLFSILVLKLLEK